VTVIFGCVSSVVVRFVTPPDPPGRNSATVPWTVTASPTATVGAEPVKTNRPSLVAGLSSGCGSWNHKPLPLLAITTPVTLPTSLPLSGDRCAAPWMSWILASIGSAGGGVLVSTFGDGATSANSAPLLSASAVGTLRVADVVFEVPGAATVSKSLAAPYPTKSITPGAVAQPVAQLRLVAELTRATFPEAADMFTPPVASGVGSGWPLAPPDAPCAR
jgi:hypothetical protein